MNEKNNLKINKTEVRLKKNNKKEKKKKRKKEKKEKKRKKEKAKGTPVKGYVCKSDAFRHP